MNKAEAPGSSGPIPEQFALINLLKAGAAQLIVLHHLAFYGPMADVARPLMPGLVDWLDAYGRVAVQVFLVIGGFLAARSLSPNGTPGVNHPLGTIWRRYLKLAPAFMAAMLLAIAASALARLWMDHDSISAPASVGQLAAHMLLLHDVLGYEALSAGVWYVAIDFQLYAALTLLVWIAGRAGDGHRFAVLAPLAVLACVSASLLYFNLDAGWDIWAPYFFGSYGLGALAWWLSDRRYRAGAMVLLLSAIVLPTVYALNVDYRVRIAVALAVACLLFLFGRMKLGRETGMRWAIVNYLATISYSVFLVHFPVCLVVNALFTRFMPEQAGWQAFGMLCAWLSSVAVGAAFCRWVEGPLARRLAAPGKPKAVPAEAVKAAR